MRIEGLHLATDAGCMPNMDRSISRGDDFLHTLAINDLYRAKSYPSATVHTRLASIARAVAIRHEQVLKVQIDARSHVEETEPVLPVQG